MKSRDLYPAIFSRHAAAYQARLEEVMTRGEARGRQRMLDLLGARPGMRVLDLACGPGNLSARLAAAVGPAGEVTGVDLAPGMIELASARHIPNARFALMDIEELAFADASFDAAACGHGLQFAADLHRALTEARRVLRPHARFAASVPTQSPSQGVQTLLDEVIARRLPPAPRAVDQDATRRAVADPEALRSAVLDAGFASADVETVEERVVWPSAEQLVAKLSSWWDCAARLDGLTDDQRADFIDEAVTMLTRRHPGPIETSARNLVLLAIA